MVYIYICVCVCVCVKFNIPWAQSRHMFGIYHHKLHIFYWHSIFMGECIGHVIREVTEQLIVTCMRGKIAKKGN